MATVTDNIADARLRDSVYMLKYARQTYKLHARLVDEAIADILLRLNVRAPESNTLTAVRYNTILNDLKKIGSALYDALEAAAKGDIKSLAEYEAAATAQAISASYPIKMVVNTVSPQQIYAAAMARPFQGKLLREWYKDQSYAAQQQYRAAIKLGFIEGETIPQISSRIREIGRIEKRHAETIARTAINHTANVAMRETSMANSDILAGEVWSSTLDGRTTPICQARDGKVYSVGSGPYPPAHHNCRSVRSPKTKTWKELGFDGMDDEDELSARPFVADKRKVKDIKKEDRKKLIGKTEKTYNDWLKTQPRLFVEDVLGKTKSKLYLDGGVTLDRFIDRKGTSLTLDQIADREWGKKAFKRAGIDP